MKKQLSVVVSKTSPDKNNIWIRPENDGTFTILYFTGSGWNQELNNLTQEEKEKLNNALNIKGNVLSEDDLPQNANIGEVFIVGEDNKDLYFCVGENEDGTPIWKSDPEIEDLTKLIEEKLEPIQEEIDNIGEVIDEKLIPIEEKLNTIEEGAQVNVQADWEQNDDTADNYIKGRTHYEYNSLSNIFNWNVTTNIASFSWGLPSVILGNTYYVSVDNGKEKQTIATKTEEDDAIILNFDDEIIFRIFSNGFYLYIPDAPHLITLKKESIEVKTLDEKFIPNTFVKKDELIKNIQDGNAEGSLRTVGTTQESSTYELGKYSFSEGYKSQSGGIASHSEGVTTLASGRSSHAEGEKSKSTNNSSHAEGYSTEATGKYSHAENYMCFAIGDNSHAEGDRAYAWGISSHAEGLMNKANKAYQHVFGAYNNYEQQTAPTDKGIYIEIVGNGTSSTKLSNARTLDWSGNEVLSGKITANGIAISDSISSDTSANNKLVNESRLQSALDDKQIFEFITPSVSGQSFINCTYIGGNENLEQGPWYRKGEKCGEFAVDPNKDDITPVKEYIPVVGGPRVLKNDWAIVQYDESKCFAVIHDYKYERQKDGGDSDYGFVKLANGGNAYIQIFTEGPMAGALYFVDDSRVLIQDHDITFVITSVSDPSNAVLEFYDNDFTQPVAMYDLGLPTCRYICTQEQTDENPPKFTLQYVVENVPFTENQLAALNSGVNSTAIERLYGIEEGAQVNTQSDWEQNDSSADDYIKNRICYEETVKPNSFENPTARKNGNAGEYLLEVGKKYNVRVDDIEYNEIECILRYPTFGSPCPALLLEGNSRNLGDKYIDYWEANECIGYSENGASGTVRLYIEEVGSGGTIIKQLDEKFIPDTIARKEDIKNFTNVVEENNTLKVSETLQVLDENNIYGIIDKSQIQFRTTAYQGQSAIELTSGYFDNAVAASTKIGSNSQYSSVTEVKSVASNSSSANASTKIVANSPKNANVEIGASGGTGYSDDVHVLISSNSTFCNNNITIKAHTPSQNGKGTISLEADNINLSSKEISSIYGINNTVHEIGINDLRIYPGCYNFIDSGIIEIADGTFDLLKPEDYGAEDTASHVLEYNGSFRTNSMMPYPINFTITGCTMLGDYENLEVSSAYQFSVLDKICIVIKVN